MPHPWLHIGRLWTNGEPFLAIDATLRHSWRGFSDDAYDKVAGLGPQDTSIPVGAGRAVLVRDDSWVEVFEMPRGRVAFVQACGPDYPDVLAGALGYPDGDDQDGDTLRVSSGEVAIFSAVWDGTGRYSVPLVSAAPGPVPLVHGPPSGGVDPGLLLSAAYTAHKLKVRWYTELGDDICFARWLLVPVRASE